jgi:NAD(P)-dependent dehydrogenase (short-subunit alcohol dehydrogenase family)
MVVLITGSNSGIGRATALRLARRGDDVYASVRDLEAGSQLQALAEAEQLRLHVLKMDVTDEASVSAGVSRLLDEAGRIDVLINNAGVGKMAAIEEASDADLHHLFETNFHGPLRVIRAALPSMRRQHHGVIVNVTSLLGRLVITPMGPYAASKHALEAASEALAQEVRAYGIRVAIVEPGIVITPMLREHVSLPASTLYADQHRRAIAIFRRLAASRTSAEDVAAVIQQAIDSDETRLRYFVGEDSAAYLARRARLSDEAWLGPERRLTDDEWYDLAEEAMGLDFRPRRNRRAA